MSNTTYIYIYIMINKYILDIFIQFIEFHESNIYISNIYLFI